MKHFRGIKKLNVKNRRLEVPPINNFQGKNIEYWLHSNDSTHTCVIIFEKRWLKAKKTIFKNFRQCDIEKKREKICMEFKFKLSKDPTISAERLHPGLGKYDIYFNIKNRPFRAHYYFCFNFSLIKESHLEYQYTLV